MTGGPRANQWNPRRVAISSRAGRILPFRSGEIREWDPVFLGIGSHRIEEGGSVGAPGAEKQGIHATLRLIGLETSPYSLKLHSDLRSKWIPLEWIDRNRKNEAPFQKHARIQLIPLVLFSDDDSMQDSSPIIERLEAQYPEPSIHPDEPVAAAGALRGPPQAAANGARRGEGDERTASRALLAPNSRASRESSPRPPPPLRRPSGVR